MAGLTTQYILKLSGQMVLTLGIYSILVFILSKFIIIVINESKKEGESK